MKWPSNVGMTVLWGGRIVDIDHRVPSEPVRITVARGVIDEIALIRGEERCPDDAIDLTSRYVIPGLIDSHYHFTDDLFAADFRVPPPLEGEHPRSKELFYFVLGNVARAFLRAGITTARDVGSYDDDGITLREAVRLGLVPGPQIVTCGRIISATAPGGRMFKTMYVQADGPWEMRRAVRGELQRGADYIKLMAGGARSVINEDPERPQMTPEEIAALVDEARRLGLRVAAHAEGFEAAKLAVEARVDTVEHGLSLHREPRLLCRMAEQGSVLVPTITTFHDIAERFANHFAPPLVDQAKRQQEEAHRTLVLARDEGVILAMGFDSGPAGSNALELVRMVEGGLTAYEGLVAATYGSARALGLADRGIVRPRFAADLIVLDSNPLDGVSGLLDPDLLYLVLRNGEPVGGKAFDGQLVAPAAGAI